jgi:hypothetical protein
MPEPRNLRQSYTRVTSVLMIVVGIALLVRTFAAGGGPVATGVLLGVLFVAAGAGRLYLQSRGS